MSGYTFQHEKLKAYQQALHFVAWAEAVIESLPAKIAAKDQLDRASTSVVLNIAEGNGKRSRADRCRYLDSARGSALECAACLDVLSARKKIDPSKSAEGKALLLGAVSMISGLIGYFEADASGSYVSDNPDEYGLGDVAENEKDKENEKD
jgi:four helix bundle protein